MNVNLTNSELDKIAAQEELCQRRGDINWAAQVNYRCPWCGNSLLKYRSLYYVERNVITSCAICHRSLVD